MLARAGHTIEPSLEVNDTATLLDLIEAGLGVAILAEAIAAQRAELKTVSIRPAAGGLNRWKQLSWPGGR
jgi:DNA-binding transcriptional LysR family regulator